MNELREMIGAEGKRVYSCCSGLRHPVVDEHPRPDNHTRKAVRLQTSHQPPARDSTEEQHLLTLNFFPPSAGTSGLHVANCHTKCAAAPPHERTK